MSDQLRNDPHRVEKRPDEGLGPSPEDDSVAGAVSRGRWWATPFALVGGVAVAVWLVAAAIAALALLAWWLA